MQHFDDPCPSRPTPARSSACSAFCLLPAAGWCLLIKLKFKDMGRVMKFKDLFGPYAAYVKKNEPLACPETAPALSGRSQAPWEEDPGDPAGGVGWGGGCRQGALRGAEGAGGGRSAA